MKKIAVTTGDPAGIGPEIASKALRFFPLNQNVAYIVYGKLLPYPDGNTVTKIESAAEAVNPESVYWIEIDDEVEIGKPTQRSGETAYKILERCAADLNSGQVDAVVTGPVSKEAIHKTHPAFIGHTEFFAEKSGTSNVIMSFWGEKFNLALLTTHVALSDVTANLNREILEKKFKLIHKEIGKLLESPKVAMLAVNPHAGEQGAFGDEDILIKSVLDDLKKEEIIIDGPFPADTFFAQKASNYNLIISAYHDQGLIPFKMISADEGVNVTLGLPFIRTSVDHGTAFDIAGKDQASEGSLEKALHFAEKQLFPTSEISEKNYSYFALYYDKYMAHVEYANWVRFILSQYNHKNKQNPEKVMELGCGTGNIACRLVKKEIDVDASDLSPEMLKVASRKPFAPNLFRADMLNPLPENKYDLTLLLFDSINYLLDINQIRQLLQNVYAGLKPGGMFIFDITTQKNCEENFDGFVNLEDSENEYLIHQSEFNYDELIQTSKLTFFVKKGFMFTRKDEVHKQKIYLVNELMDLINESDLKLSGIFDAHKNENLKDEDPYDLDMAYPRLFFVLEKNL